jgi:hypothetical protein
MTRRRKQPYLLADVLDWAGAYRARHGRFPCVLSGPIPETPGETWKKVDEALARGGRGFPGGSSLHQLLKQHLEAPDNRKAQPVLTVSQILAWADAWYAREGYWLRICSGAIPEAPGTTWRAVAAALASGLRGLPGGDTLPQLLASARGAPSARGRKPDKDLRRRLIEMREREKLSFRDIGRRLGMTKQAAHTTYHKALTEQDREQ